MNQDTATTIGGTLRAGGRLHGFRSGGGLRVLRVERDGELIGYSEHPNVTDAMRILAEDLRAGGRDYAAVYGPIETPYLTGSSTPDGDLDAWLLRGCTFDACGEGAEIVAALQGWQHHETPKDIAARAMAGETIEYEANGMRYEASPTRFPNGEAAMSTRCLSETKTGADPWMWRIKQTGRGADLATAVAAAFASEPERI
jgi:hypothetical protein